MSRQGEHVIAAPKTGRNARLEELYRVQIAPLQRLAFLLTSDHHVAEDITQQAFVKFYRRFFHLRRSEAAAAYLRTTVVNLARAHHRRKRREREHLEAHSSREGITPSPDFAERDQVIRALMLLPYRQRAAIVLRFYEDLSEHQAADALGCSPAAMKSLTARAMASLRAAELEGGRDAR